MKGLTDKQIAILEYIQQYNNDTAGMPSIRDIMDHFEIASNRGCTVHLDALERKGYLTRPHTARSIQLTKLGLDAVLHIVKKNPLYQLGWADCAKATP